MYDSMDELTRIVPDDVKMLEVFTALVGRGYKEKITADLVHFMTAVDTDGLKYIGENYDTLKNDPIEGPFLTYCEQELGINFMELYNNIFGWV